MKASSTFLPASETDDLAESSVWIRGETFNALLAAVGVLLWLAGIQYVTHAEDFMPGWGIPVAMLVGVAACYWVKTWSFQLAGYLFSAVLLAGPTALVFAPGQTAYAPILFVPAVLVIGALQSGSQVFVLAGLASLVLLAARPLAGASFPPEVTPTALAIIWLTALASWTTTKDLYLALHWALTNSDQASRNLAEAREFQGKLAAANRQLEEANYRLERANHALVWARAEADQARRLKAQFAATVSHELRTPLNLVVGFAELMLDSPETYGGAKLPPAYLTDLTAVQRSARHLQGLIDDILDLSQIDAGEMPILKDYADVGAIVQEAVATIHQLLERKGLRIEVHVEPELPLLQLDRLRIRQVLLNLLNNAARFTDRGSVAIRARRADSEVVVEVADTGLGIQSDDLKHLFEPFHQVDPSPTHGRGGTGLGLAISKRFVELHGGRIWVQSAGVVGQGSTFGFALPVALKTDEPSGEPQFRGVERHWSASAPAPEPTVVVVDDDPAVVGLFRRHLEGYQVVGADDEAAGLKLAVERRAHAVVADLPEAAHLTEWQAHWTATSTADRVRVVGCPMPSGRRVARSLGLVDYLVKPVTRAALATSIRSVAPAARTVLVVDDDPQMVRLLSRMLRSLPDPPQILRAHDGAEALERLRRDAPDLVLLDLLMPQVDGFTVLEQMRRDPGLARIPVVAVSARGAVEAVSPTAGRTVAVIEDAELPVSRLIHLVRSVLDSLPPAEAAQAGPAP